MRDFFKQSFPIYKKIFGITLAIWTAPTEPVKHWMMYLKAMRITLRKNSKVLFVIKKGEI